MEYFDFKERIKHCIIGDNSNYRFILWDEETQRPLKSFFRHRTGQVRIYRRWQYDTQNNIIKYVLIEKYKEETIEHYYVELEYDDQNNLIQYQDSHGNYWEEGYDTPMPFDLPKEQYLKYARDNMRGEGRVRKNWEWLEEKEKREEKLLES